MIIHYMQDRDRALPLSPIPGKTGEIDAYPVNEIAEYVQDVSQGDIDVLVEEYYNKYDMILDGRAPEEFKKHVAVQAGIEIGFELLPRGEKLSGYRNTLW